MRISPVVVVLLGGGLAHAEPKLGPYAQELASDEPVAHFRLRGADPAIATADADGSQKFAGTAIALVPPRDVEPDAVTLEGWFRVQTPDADLLAFGTSPTATDALVLALRAGKLHGSLRGEQLATTLAVAPRGWHHVAIRFEARHGELAIVLDGVHVAAIQLGDRTPLARGGRVFAGGAGSGNVDEVAVHERALPASRLLSHVLVARRLLPPTAPPASTAVALLPQRGHKDRVMSVAVTPDGALALSQGNAGDLKMWDVASGREVRSPVGVTLPGARAIDPTGRFAIVGKSETVAALLELATGKLVREFKVGEGFEAAISPDGTRVVFASKSVEALVSVRDLATGRELGRVHAGKDWSARAFAIDPAGNWIVFAASNWLSGARGLYAVRLATLTATRELATAKIRFSDEPREIYATAFIDGGTRFAAFACEAQNPHSDCHKTSIRIVDLATGAEADRLAAKFGSLSQDAVVSDNAKLVAFGSGRHGVQVWDVHAKQAIANAPLHVFTGSSAKRYKFLNPGIRGLALANTTLVTGGDDGEVVVSTFPDLKFVRTMARPLPDIERAALGRDGKHAIVATRDGLHRWELASLKLDRNIRHGLESIGALALSADGKLALVAGGIEVWPRDLPRGWEERWRATPVHGVPTVGVWQIVDLENGRARQLIRGHIVEPGRGGPTVIAAAFSDDAQWLATADATGGLKAFSTTVGAPDHGFARARTAATFRDDAWTAVAVAPGGTLVAGGTQTGRVNLAVAPITPPDSSLPILPELMDAADATLSLATTNKPIASLEIANATLVATSTDGSRRAWRIAVDRSAKPRIVATPTAVAAARSQRPVANPALARALGSPVRAIVDDHGGAVHAAVMADQTVAIWTRDAQRAVRIAAVGDRWVAYGSDGTFDASIDGADLVAMVLGTKAYGIDQFAVQWNRPDRLLANLGIAAPDLVAHLAQQHLRRTRKAGFTEQTLPIGRGVPSAFIAGAEVAGPRATLTLQLASELELAAYNVFVNGVPIYAPPGKPASGKRARVVEAIELSAGTNKIEVVAVDKRGIESYRALTFAQRDAALTNGDLYVLAFGVSKYRDSSLDLSFASKDARDLGALLRQAKGYGRVNVKVFEDAGVTVNAIREARAFLAAAKVDDTFVLAIMGHGIHDRDPAATYYFVTHEADVDRLAATSASFDLVEGLLYGIAPRRKLFLMDTCESGELDPAAERAMVDAAAAKQLAHRGLVRVKKPTTPAPTTAPRPYVVDRDRFVYLDLARRSGAVVFSSSRGGELSYEDSRLQNGVFTHAVIAALTSRDADGDRDGWISVAELRAHVEGRVAQATGGLQHPTIDRDNIAVRIGLPMVTATTRAP